MSEHYKLTGNICYLFIEKIKWIMCRMILVKIRMSVDVSTKHSTIVCNKVSENEVIKKKILQNEMLKHFSRQYMYLLGELHKFWSQDRVHAA